MPHPGHPLDTGLRRYDGKTRLPYLELLTKTEQLLLKGCLKSYLSPQQVAKVRGVPVENAAVTPGTHPHPLEGLGTGSFGCAQGKL